MIVLLDTNVVMSALFFSKALVPILSHWAEGTFTVALSKEIADEYNDVYERMVKKTGRRSLESIFKAILTSATYYEPVNLKMQICKDPDDDMFLACALACQASYITTGDKLLLEVGEIGMTQIIKPADFIKLLP